MRIVDKESKIITKINSIRTLHSFELLLSMGKYACTHDLCHTTVNNLLPAFDRNFTCSQRDNNGCQKILLIPDYFSATVVECALFSCVITHNDCLYRLISLEYDAPMLKIVGKFQNDGHVDVSVESFWYPYQQFDVIFNTKNSNLLIDAESTVLTILIFDYIISTLSADERRNRTPITHDLLVYISQKKKFYLEFNKI